MPLRLWDGVMIGIIPKLQFAFLPLYGIRFVVLIGQVKRYFPYESRHQHGAIDMTGGFKYFLCSSLFGEDSHFDSYFSNGLKPPTGRYCLSLGDVSGFSHFFRVVSGDDFSNPVQCFFFSDNSSWQDLTKEVLLGVGENSLSMANPAWCCHVIRMPSGAPWKPQMERSSHDGPSGFSYDLLDIFPNGLEGGFACLEVRENHSSYGAIYIYIYTYTYVMYI